MPVEQIGILPLGVLTVKLTIIIVLIAHAKMPKIQTCIIDDHPLILRGLAALFGNHPNIKVVETIQGDRDIEETLRSIAAFDVAVVDLRMPEVDGFEVFKIIGRLFPNARTLAYTAYGQSDAIRKAISAGASGFVSKLSDVHVLAEGIERIHAEGVYFCPQSQEVISSDLLNVGVRNLTEREQEIFNLLKSDRSNNEISKALHISYSTARFHIKNIYRKLGVTERSQLRD